MGDAAFLPLAGQPGWHVRLHPKALTPDPTYGNPVPGGESIDFRIDVFPWKLVCCRPSQPAAEHAHGDRQCGYRVPRLR